ncbi:MAG: peptidoglycan-binding protein LysM [Pseudomonadota bacterium]|jgi:nucleoid-associated protein YgaU|uniref:Potassium binding protein Kbp n=1 Tax=Zoogloea ramigera TaxID=350 RepID=A0A4Y4CUH2_ZOORA|nr:peptidoglycan-binding protein LysM [Zoogloea ramigera]MBP7628210.1 peptidoglycan-binding protein LysM [Zoogloea sp.]GEC96605.1 peptidoglycan-binding protein LysM [Zoogloea ramigera]
MGLLSFVREAGEKLFGRKDVEAAAAESAQDKLADLNQKAAAAIVAYIDKQGLDASALTVSFDGASSTVTVAGTVADQATKEKVLLCCGNVDGVDKVDDQLTVTNPEPPATFHTVVRGDTLSAIAKACYGNANAYMKIFEANKPMLSDPNKIYPGQVLRIPA